jgi:hypothetical protein
VSASMCFFMAMIPLTLKYIIKPFWHLSSLNKDQKTNCHIITHNATHGLGVDKFYRSSIVHTNKRTPIEGGVIIRFVKLNLCLSVFEKVTSNRQTTHSFASFASKTRQLVPLVLD